MDWESWASVQSLRGEKSKRSLSVTTGGAFAVCQQCWSDMEQIKSALLEAFATDSFVAYKWFNIWHLCKGEMTAVYLAELCKLSQLFCNILEQVIICTFMDELAIYDKQLLFTSSHMETMVLVQILTQARVIMKYKTSAYKLIADATQYFGVSCYTESPRKNQLS